MGTIHIVDASRRYCTRCGLPLPQEIAGRSDLEPGSGAALSGGGVLLLTLDQLATGEHAGYVLCMGQGSDPRPN